uniref:TAZ-type domain-containing protein n=2 Tax=Caenorhabditis japonica TaxID=281687 RepID=A0A8R1INV0_CAEJA
MDYGNTRFSCVKFRVDIAQSANFKESWTQPDIKDIILCKKCARRAKHSHPLKAFRPRDETLLNLRKHLTLSYSEHIVSCTRDLCMESCHESRYARTHFNYCQIRPLCIRDIVDNGNVKFVESNCQSCELFITCVFIHADKCRVENCEVQWCDDIRKLFEMGQEGKPVFEMTDDMNRKCQE